tara:strand:- start:4763 stop:5389 length:627 start_codon:yes stop_codon:yes gene_type:complete
MTKKQKLDFLIKILDRLYPNPNVPLYHKDPYTLLIAVLLSAQCTDERVNLITPKLFNAADNPVDMCKLSIDEIKNIIRPCGLSNTKSKGIYNSSQILVKAFNSKVPQNFADLESLPSVGHKTASVVLSQAFGIPTFPVDTHIHRMLYRWGISNGKNVKQTEKDAKKFFPKEKWNKLHLQIIFYAREYSPARGWDLDVDFITKRIKLKG